MADYNVILQEGAAKVLVGNSNAACDVELFAREDFGLVVNCTPDLPFLDTFARYRMRVAVQDVCDPRDVVDLRAQLPAIVEEMRIAVQAGKSVLVHCHAGRQRSATVAAAYLQARDGIGRDEAIRAVQSRRREAFWPQANFYDALA